jgi:hypothetical protein
MLVLVETDNGKHATALDQSDWYMFRVQFEVLVRREDRQIVHLGDGADQKVGV